MERVFRNPVKTQNVRKITDDTGTRENYITWADAFQGYLSKLTLVSTTT